MSDTYLFWMRAAGYPMALYGWIDTRSLSMALQIYMLDMLASGQ